MTEVINQIIKQIIINKWKIRTQNKKIIHLKFFVLTSSYWSMADNFRL